MLQSPFRLMSDRNFRRIPGIILPLLLLPLFYQYGSVLSYSINQAYFFLLFSISGFLFCISIATTKFRVSWNSIDTILTFFVVTIITLSSNKEKFFLSDQFLNLTSLYFCYWIFRIYASKVADLRSFAWCLVCISFITQINCILQIIGIVNANNSNFFVTGFFGNPNNLNAYLVINIPWTLYLAQLYFYSNVEKANFLVKLFFILNVILTVALSLATITRATIFIIFILFALYAICWVRKNSPALRLKVGIFIILSIVIVVLLLAEIKSESSKGRLLIWKISFEMVQERPLLGIGYGKFEAYYNKYQSDYFKKGLGNKEEKYSADEIFTPLSDFLQILIESGLITLCAFVLLFLKVLLKLIKSLRYTPQFTLFYPALALCIIFFLCIISSPLNEPAIAVLFFGVLGVFSSQSDLTINNVEDKYRWPVHVFLISMLCLFSLIDLRRFTSIKKWVREEHEPILRATSLPQYHALYAELSSNSIFLLDYGARLLSNGYPRQASQILNSDTINISNLALHLQLASTYMALNNESMAEKNFIIAVNMVPSRFVPKYALFKFYLKTNQIKKMKALGRLILTMPVKFPSIQIAVMKSEIQYDLISLKNNN